MQAMIDISEPELGEIRNRFEEAGKPKDGVTIQIVVNWSPDGIPVFHMPAIVTEPASLQTREDAEKTQTPPSDPKQESLSEIRKKWPWAGIAAEGIRHDVSHDWTDIQRSIEEGWTAEFAEKERRLFAECAREKK